AQLADVYRQQISTLPLRIQVNGNPLYLKQSDKVSLIRAILLGGVRAGFLWLQLGGRPWRLLLQRRRMFRIAAELSG
ncbi:MAG: lysogenization regulator HflD, partial [Gammaproteobacteria bacterium]|nr:lysogenization regulator HflD [Gammaproteobacteria bacterium]